MALLRHVNNFFYFLIYFLFQVNTSRQFVGLAEMLGPIDFKKTTNFWEEDKWNVFSL
jgi:hypothetical protein